MSVASSSSKIVGLLDPDGRTGTGAAIKADHRFDGLGHSLGDSHFCRLEVFNDSCWLAGTHGSSEIGDMKLILYKMVLAVITRACCLVR